MKKEPILSILTIGFHEEIVNKLLEWDQDEVITYLGMLETRIENQDTSKYPSISKLTIQEKEMDLIVICEKNVLFINEAKQIKKENTVILDKKNFWIIEKLAKQLNTMKRLYKDQKLFRTLLMYSHEGVQFVDENGIVQFVNQSFSRITNISPEERIGQHIGDVSPNGALNRAYKTKSPVLGYKSTGVGSNVETISNAAPVFVDGKFVGAVTTFQDVTEVRYLSQQLLEKEQEQWGDETLDNKGHEANFTFNNIIGESEIIKDVINLAKKVTRTRSTVLITAESGTGKELFAHAIHSESPFNNKPFVAVNCASIPNDLLESELFGYEKGAFTGASSKKIGKIEFANGGTLFLDEIGSMNLSLQAKLLRVLQYKEFERVGGLQKIKNDFRIICATNEDLQSLVQKKKFREDLYYRLNVIQLEIPPLRKRKQDIPLLVEYLMDNISKKVGLNQMQLTNKGIALLNDYNWPGNIRELENFLERLMNESTSSVIPDSLVKENIQRLIGISPTKIEESQHAYLSFPPTLPLRTVEREYIIRALDHFGKSLDGKKKAARSLGISISTLYNKVKDYQLD